MLSPDVLPEPVRGTCTEENRLPHLTVRLLCFSKLRSIAVPHIYRGNAF